LKVSVPASCEMVRSPTALIVPVWLAPLTAMVRCSEPDAWSVAPSAMLIVPPGPNRLLATVSVPPLRLVAPL
jgi:hypothetical protein